MSVEQTIRNVLGKASSHCESYEKVEALSNVAMVVANPYIPSLSIHSSWIHLLEKGIGYCYSQGCYRNMLPTEKKMERY